jgi:hypothetical protein
MNYTSLGKYVLVSSGKEEKGASGGIKEVRDFRDNKDLKDTKDIKGLKERGRYTFLRSFYYTVERVTTAR